MSTLTIGSIDLKMRVMCCAVCGINYAAPEAFMARKQRDGGDWYCPNGHSLIFTETEVDKVKQQLGKEQERTNYYRTRYFEEQEQREAVERSRAAIKGQLTKVKKRVANGVCPCCNRTFANLARHMKSQHPEFEGEAPE